MDCDVDSDLLWIAREGIKAPLPDDWKPCKSSNGSVYYFNIITGESKFVPIMLVLDICLFDLSCNCSSGGSILETIITNKCT
jgi:hypothetical protein